MCSVPRSLSLSATRNRASGCLALNPQCPVGCHDDLRSCGERKRCCGADKPSYRKPSSNYRKGTCNYRKGTTQPNSLTSVARAFAMLSTGFRPPMRAYQSSSPPHYRPRSIASSSGEDRLGPLRNRTGCRGSHHEATEKSGGRMKKCMKPPSAW